MRKTSGRREVLARLRLTVHDEREDAQELRQPERRDHHHDQRRVAQPADHHGFGAAADAGRDRQRARERHPVRNMPAHHGDTHQRGTERADLTMGEVDDARRPVDEDKADGEDAVHHPGDRSQRDHRPTEVKTQDAHRRDTRLAAPSRKTDRTRSGRAASSAARPSNRISPFSMKYA